VRIVLHPDECHGVLSRQIQFEIGGIQASEGLWIVWLEVFRANSHKVLQRLCFRYGALGIRITKREKVSVKPGKREVMEDVHTAADVQRPFASIQRRHAALKGNLPLNLHAIDVSLEICPFPKPVFPSDDLLRIVQEAAGWHTLASLVSAGVGIGVVPGSIAEFAQRGVVYRPVRALDVQMSLSAVWKRGERSPVRERFVAALASVAGGRARGARD